MFIHDAIRAHLLEQAGMVEQRLGDFDIDDLRRTEWNSDFEQKMRNRLVQGAFRYGRLREKTGYDTITAAIERLARYRDLDPNQEHLIDVANFVMLEYGRRDVREDAYFESRDGSEIDGRRVKLCRGER